MHTIKTVLYKSKILSDKKHPIYIRLSLNKKTFYLPIYKNDQRFKAVCAQWDNQKCRLISQKKINEEHLILNNIINDREMRLRSIIQKDMDNNIVFSIQTIRNRFYNSHHTTDLISYIDALLEKDKKSGTQTNLPVLKKDLLDFNNGNLIQFSDVDYEFVTEFIGYQKHKSRNNTTIGIRLRYLRKVLNSALNDNIGSKTTYPFSNEYGAQQFIKISRYEKNERKIAIDRNCIDIIKNECCKKIQNEIARRLFIASYSGHGMNFKDMAKLTSENIYTANGHTYIVYNRNKTNINLNFRISPLLAEQLNWFKKNTTLINGHIFPIISDKIIDENKYLHKKLTNYNYRLKQVAKELNIDGTDMQLSSYVSRHSFATNLFHNDVSVNIISQALGHTNINTTNNYLKKFSEIS